MMTKFKGIIPAIITPFTENGDLYITGLKNELNYLYKCGFENLFICGSYGSFPLLSVEERKLVAEVCTNFCVPKGIKTIIQIGSTNPIDSIELAKHAEFVGADAISSVVPFYYSSTIYNEKTFLEYFEKLIKSVSIDVHCYNNTKTTGFNVTPKFLSKLIDVGLKGIKDGGSEPGRILEMLEIIDEKTTNFDYYPSSTNSLLMGFMLGVEACISGVALSIPNEVLEVYKSIKEHKINKAKKIYRKVMKIRAILGEKGGRAIAAYDILNTRIGDVGTCRFPWVRLSQEDQNELLTKFRNNGYLL